MDAPVDQNTNLSERLDLQRKAFYASLPVSARTRRDRLERALELLRTHGDELVAAICADFGSRPALLSQFTDISSSVQALAYAKKNVGRWMKSESRAVRVPLALLGARGWIEYQPKGVVGIISPWNYPVNLTFSPLAGALAAGNRVMIKPSEHTPRTSELMEELFARHFAAEEVDVIRGGPEVAAEFSALPFDHLLFTGSSAVGRKVMAAAAENLTPVTLELGGKSPTVVDSGADIEAAAARICFGKLLNGGQTCLAPDHVYVPEHAVEQFVEVFRRTAKEMFGELAGNDEYTAIINGKHYERLISTLREAEASETRVERWQDHVPDERKVAPTLVVNPSSNLRLMSEEIFGPILPILPYSDLSKVIARINARPRPLSMYWFGDTNRRYRQLLNQTFAGGMTINDTIFHVANEDLPFGGVGASGMGQYHGREGFETFSHAKSIYQQARVNAARLIGAVPPYGKRLEHFLKLEDFGK